MKRWIEVRKASGEQTLARRQHLRLKIENQIST